MTVETIETTTLSVAEMAKLIGISENTAYTYLENKTIPGRKLGKKWIITRSLIIQWMNESK